MPWWQLHILIFNHMMHSAGCVTTVCSRHLAKAIMLALVSPHFLYFKAPSNVFLCLFFTCALQTTHWLSYTASPRAKIFRRDQSTVTSLEGIKAVMRGNDYKNDPVSASVTIPFSVHNRSRHPLHGAPCTSCAVPCCRHR